MRSGRNRCRCLDGWLARLALRATLACTPWTAAAEPAHRVTVRPDRPRIFLHPLELAIWQQRFQQIPALREVYAATRRDLLGRSEPPDNPYVSSMELQCFALFYLAEGRAKEPLQRAKQWMEHFAAGTIGDHWGHPLVTKAMSIAYDWLYPDLSVEERRRYGEAIVRYAEATMNFPYLLWYDPNAPTMNFSKLEKGRWFRGLGQVNVRSGWGKEDTLGVYRAGRVYGGHGHYSAGHFLIYRKGNLLVEDGHYGVMGAEAHNTLYIGGEMRKLARSTHQHFFAEMDGSTFDYGRITGYYHDDAFARYDWIDSDLTRAYTPQQAEKVTRRFVFLRPRTFLIVDYIRSPEGVEKRFRLHAPTTPQIDAAKRLASWQDGEGRLFVQTVLPAEARWQTAPGKMSHLCTVSRPRPSREETFLHVLHAADLNKPAPMATPLRTDGFVGVRVQAPGTTWVVWLRPDGKRAREITYTVESAQPVRHLITDLAAQSYRVRGVNALAGVLRRKGAAPLYFESAGGGKFSIVAAK